MQRALLVTVGARVAGGADTRRLGVAIDDRTVYALLAAVELEVRTLAVAVRQRQLKVVDAHAVTAAVDVAMQRVDRTVASLAANAFPAGRARAYRLLRVTVA